MPTLINSLAFETLNESFFKCRQVDKSRTNQVLYWLFASLFKKKFFREMLVLSDLEERSLASQTN